MTAVAAERVLICVEGHVGPWGALTRGERVRSDHAAVKAAPHFFVEDGIVESEWPSHWDRLAAKTEKAELAEREERQRRFEEQARKNPVKIEAAVVKATSDFAALVDGKPALIRKGSTVVAGTVLHVDHPEHFQ